MSNATDNKSTHALTGSSGEACLLRGGFESSSLSGGKRPTGRSLLEHCLPPMGFIGEDPSFHEAASPRSNATRAREGVTARRLARILTRVSGVDAVCAAVLRQATRVVPSRLGAFAVPTETGALMIVATHGYSALLVQDLRIQPGSGILGSVYANGTLLRVEDATRFAVGHRRRARYRTNSFLVVPVKAGEETLGVLSLSDRLDDQPFSPEDAAAIRALMAPTALALGREAARREARRFLHASTIDPVSGLFNRRYFHVRLGEELERAQRHGMSVALLMLDIDDFKRINDDFGHVAGDIVIRDISEILRHSVRVFDVCTRYGGDEFAIVMPGIGSENAASIAERIRHRLDVYQPQAPEFMHLRVTASIGLAVSEGIATRELVDRADRALLHAKSSGKNRVVRATPIGPTSSNNTDAISS